MSFPSLPSILPMPKRSARVVPELKNLPITDLFSISLMKDPLSFSRGASRIFAAATVKQITAECCHFAADHQDRFPTAEEWREIVMPYLPQAKNLPCVEHYRYEGTGRKLCDKESGTKPVIYCDTHKIVAFTSGFCNIDSSYFSKQDSVRSATKEQKKWGFPE